MHDSQCEFIKYGMRLLVIISIRARWRRGHNFEAKDSKKVRGQDQGPSCLGQVASRTRTERLEAKDSKTRLKIRANINVNIVIMISQAFKRKIV